ncbi:hypothetical protein F5141DRAFT_1214773 [Pisolithus sp. B1]|nr:hypothetical protein F5141DRAFT_1214773 [Pisolithus sp. B1]
MSRAYQRSVCISSLETWLQDESLAQLFESDETLSACEMGMPMVTQRDATVWSNTSKRWAEFETDPKKSGKHEDETFKSLSKVFDAVVREASKTAGTPAKLRFASRHLEAPISGRTNSTCPSAYLLLVGKKGADVPEDKKAHTSEGLPDSWDDIAVSFEFKKGTEGIADSKDDDQKVIWNLQHIMRSDPCRRATFGVTIENTEMRFWFTCRAVMLVSKSFNFCTPEHLIHFFCSLVFAEDHELGWDPTTQRVCVGGKIQYNIIVRTDGGKDLVYQTTRVIYDYSADALSGRGTRVFEARLIFLNGTLVKDAKPVVLKDSRRDCDRDREDIILNQIFADLQKHKGPEQEEEARKNFLTVLAAGNVMVDGNIDSTDCLLRGSNLSTDRAPHRVPVDEIPKEKPIRSGEGFTPIFRFAPYSTKRSRVHHRTRFRLVFKEVCQSIYELPILDTVFATLEDARKGSLSCNVRRSGGLYAIFQLCSFCSVDWVHRDTSASNVLRWGQIGKLGDLEYAKHMDSITSHEARMGTLNFMACEVEAHNYLFQLRRGRPFGRVRKCPFRFNPLHDMESMPSEGHIDAFHKLFPGRLDERFSTFSAPLDYEVLPIPFHPTGHAIEYMHQEILVAYTESEKEMPPTYANPLEQLHSIFADCLTSAVEHSRTASLFSPPAEQRQQDSSVKRQREDPTPDPRDPKQPKV